MVKKVQPTKDDPQAARKALIAVLLPGFEELKELWQGDNPLYPGEQPVRWAVRQHAEALAHANAIALWQKRTYVHRERFVAVVREEALRKYRERHTVEPSAPRQ